MNESPPITQHLGQAIYTWSRSRLDGTKGMGFCAISPALVPDVDWLSKLNPPEFELFPSGMVGAGELYEAREGFSHVGRTIKSGRAIIYCKTADATFDDSGRPQLLVHAVIASRAILGLSRITRVRSDFWIRKVAQQSGLPELSDLTLTEFSAGDGQAPAHTCPTAHEGALRLLRAIAADGPDREGIIEIQASDAGLDEVLLAFPRKVADEFSLDPYVMTDGVKWNLTLLMPRGESQSASSAPKPDIADPGGCALEQATRQAAKQFLYCAKPSFQSYASAALDIVEKPPRAPRAPQAPAVPPGPAVPGLIRPPVGQDANPVLPLLAKVRDGAAPLTELENMALRARLSASLVPDLLALPTGMIAEIFANVSDRELIWDWSRLFQDVPADKFSRLWNDTHLAAFLGIVLVMNLVNDQGTTRITSDRGASPEATAQVLWSMRKYPGGGRSIARILGRGLGDAELMRQFVARTFEEDPRFLFDAVLASADFPVVHMIDYIRFCFESWQSYRDLPEREAAALYETLRPTFIDKLRTIFAR